MRSNKRKEGKPSHTVSAWSREDGFCLGQKAVDEKSNEITAIPELLDKIQIKGQIVTIDAMGIQKAVVEKIRRKRADYVLALKGNQSGLYEDVKLYFRDEEARQDIRVGKRVMSARWRKPMGSWKKGNTIRQKILGGCRRERNGKA